MKFDDKAEFSVLIVDVVRSREIPAARRAELQTLLQATVARWTDRAVWPSPPALTGGDAVEAMLPAAECGPLVSLLVDLADAIHPVRLAVGFGRGGITTGLDPAITAVDGPCFHTARAAIERAAARGVWGEVEGFGAPVDRAATAMLVLMGTLRDGWTDRQAEVVRAARAHDTQKVAAAELGVARSTMSESLKAAHFEVLREGEDALAHLLAHGGTS